MHRHIGTDRSKSHSGSGGSVVQNELRLRVMLVNLTDVPGRVPALAATRGGAGFPNIQVRG